MQGGCISNDVATCYTLNHFSELWRGRDSSLRGGEGKAVEEGRGDEGEGETKCLSDTANRGLQRRRRSIIDD